MMEAELRAPTVGAMYPSSSWVYCSSLFILHDPKHAMPCLYSPYSFGKRIRDDSPIVERIEEPREQTRSSRFGVSVPIDSPMQRK